MILGTMYKVETTMEMETGHKESHKFVFCLHTNVSREKKIELKKAIYRESDCKYLYEKNKEM